jgi:hypothetical protein
MRPTSITRQKTAGRIRLRKKRLIFLLSLVLLIAVLLLGIRFLGSFQALQNRTDWAKSLRTAPQTGGTNYLLYGLSENNGEVSIEEMFFLNFPASGGPFHIIFIPGEILLHRLEEKNGTSEPLPVEGNGEKGLRPFYTPSHFYNEGGAELLIKQISFFLDTPVHHYVEASYNGIPVLVDYRGGIAYKGDILKGQDYLDYFLTGESKEEPLEKALRRASSLGNLVKFLGEKKGITNISRMIRKASPYFKTDLSWKELKEFHENLEPLFDPQSLIVQLPGSWRDFNGESFFEPNYVQLAVMMENLGKDFILPRELITVQVLNGSGVAGIASKVAELLKGEGFQVIKIDNADSFEYQYSRVISHLEQIEPAREIAVLIPGSEFFKEPLPDHPVMVTVIIGKNFSL